MMGLWVLVRSGVGLGCTDAGCGVHRGNLMVRRLAFLAPPPHHGMADVGGGGRAMNAWSLRDRRRFQPFAISKVTTVTGSGCLEGALLVTVVTFGG